MSNRELCCVVCGRPTSHEAVCFRCRHVTPTPRCWNCYENDDHKMVCLVSGKVIGRDQLGDCCDNWRGPDRIKKKEVY